VRIPEEVENHPFGNGFEDPFNGDPHTGLTAEELADLEAKGGLDPDANEDEDENMGGDD
jgi:hypothetical protein